MKTMTSKARLTTMLVFLPVWLVARDAMAAGTCDYTGSLPIDGPGLTLPNWDYCGIIEPIYTGPGAGFLTQDVSGTTSGTYALVATSLSNDAIYAYAESPGIGVLALAGTTTVPAEAAGVVASGSGAGVSGGYFISASGEGVWGVTKSSSGFALYGGGGSSTVGTAVFGDNRNESTGGNAAVNGQTGDPTGYGGFFANGATPGMAMASTRRPVSGVARVSTPPASPAFRACLRPASEALSPPPRRAVTA